MEKDTLVSTEKYVGAGDSTTPAPNTRKNSLSACVDWGSSGFEFAS